MLGAARAAAAAAAATTSTATGAAAAPLLPRCCWLHTCASRTLRPRGGTRPPTPTAAAAAATISAAARAPALWRAPGLAAWGSRRPLQLAAAPRRSFSDSIRITVASAHGDWSGEVNVGETLMDIALDNDLDMECACEGQLACSTCHVYVDEEFFDTLPEIEEEEEDMLDLAWGLEDNSRLGCQIEMTPELDGVTFTIPSDD